MITHVLILVLAVITSNIAIAINVYYDNINDYVDYDFVHDSNNYDSFDDYLTSMFKMQFQFIDYNYASVFENIEQLNTYNLYLSYFSKYLEKDRDKIEFVSLKRYIKQFANKNEAFRRQALFDYLKVIKGASFEFLHTIYSFFFVFLFMGSIVTVFTPIDSVIQTLIIVNVIYSLIGGYHYFKARHNAIKAFKKANLGLTNNCKWFTSDTIDYLFKLKSFNHLDKNSEVKQNLSQIKQLIFEIITLDCFYQQNNVSDFYIHFQKLTSNVEFNSALANLITVLKNSEIRDNLFNINNQDSFDSDVTKLRDNIYQDLNTIVTNLQAQRDYELAKSTESEMSDFKVKSLKTKSNDKFNFGHGSSRFVEECQKCNNFINVGKKFIKAGHQLTDHK